MLRALGTTILFSSIFQVLNLKLEARAFVVLYCDQCVVPTNLKRLIGNGNVNGLFRRPIELLLNADPDPSTILSIIVGSMRARPVDDSACRALMNIKLSAEQLSNDIKNNCADTRATTLMVLICLDSYMVVFEDSFGLPIRFLVNFGQDSNLEHSGTSQHFWSFIFDSGQCLRR